MYHHLYNYGNGTEQRLSSSTDTVSPSRPPYPNASPYQQQQQQPQQGSPTTTPSSAPPSQQINSQPTSQFMIIYHNNRMNPIYQIHPLYLVMLMDHPLLLLHTNIDNPMLCLLL
ncbi:unnamed protein product [Cunninghamella echinulata]